MITLTKSGKSKLMNEAKENPTYSHHSTQIGKFWQQRPITGRQ
jgi:hypothetical protein